MDRIKKIHPFKNKKEVVFLVHKEPTIGYENGFYIVKPKNNSYRAIWIVVYNKVLKLFSTSDYNTIKEIDNKIAQLDSKLTSIYNNLSKRIDEVYNQIATLSVRKTYDTKADMLADKNPIDDELKKPLKFGDLVAVIKDAVDANNGIYMYKKTEWVYVQKLGDITDMVTKSTNQTINSIKTFLKSPIIPLAINANEPSTFGQLLEVGEWITNNEWLRAYVDKEDNIIWGIKTDGTVYQPIGIPEEIKDIEDLMLLKVDKEEDKSLINSIFSDSISSVINEEYSYVIISNNNEVLFGIRKDGEVVVSNKDFYRITHDKEDRIELTIDSEDSIVSHRDKNGVLHEHSGISTKELTITEKLNISSKATDSLIENLKEANFKFGIFDWSEDSYVEIPKPSVSAKVNFITNKIPTTKVDNIQGHLEYLDKYGNYFKKPIELNAQGDSSMAYPKKNFKFDLLDDSKIKIGTWVAQDSFHLKAYYIDVFRGQNNVCYNLCEQIYQTRSLSERRPWSHTLNNHTTHITSKGNIEDDFNIQALGHPDGFPITVYFNNEFYGVYTWNIKKHRDNYLLNKSNSNHILLDGIISDGTIFNGKVGWKNFDIKNPKKLIDINGDKYDGDNPKELSNTDPFTKEVKTNIENFAKAFNKVKEDNSKETFSKYFNIPFLIDYYLEGQVVYNFDGFAKNWIWCTWDGIKWSPTFYDQDSVFGMYFTGTGIISTSLPYILGHNRNSLIPLLYKLYKSEIDERYKELRNKNVFSVENISNLFQDWVKSVGYDNYKKELKKWSQTPSYRSARENDGWQFIEQLYSEPNNFDINKLYKKGEECVFLGARARGKYRALKDIKGVTPITNFYPNTPTQGGFYNSIDRIEKWLELRFIELDKFFNYK